MIKFLLQLNALTLENKPFSNKTKQITSDITLNFRWAHQTINGTVRKLKSCIAIRIRKKNRHSTTLTMRSVTKTTPR